MGYNYLPGVQVVTNDGGLVLSNTATGKQTVILGTSATGPANTPYYVGDRATAASAFGLQGTLVQAMEEVAQGGADNILLYRIGTRAATLSGIGAETDGTNPIDAADVGLTITFGQITPTIASDYQIYYDGAGLLEIWYKGNQVYSNSQSNPIDTGDCTVTGSAVAGLAIGGSGTTHFQKSLPLSNAAIASSTSHTVSGSPGYTEPALVLDLGDTGLSFTPGAAGFDPCKLYEALQDAYNLLEIMPLQQVFVPNARWDTPNVAYYNPSSLTSDATNPANGAALGWLKTTIDASNNVIYTWAHKTRNSAGTTVVPPTFTNAADRLTQGFHEVHFSYQLARFCAKQSQNQGGCIGFIGFNGPKNYKPAGLKSWIGALPTYDVNANFENQYLGNPATAGSGLCGTALLSGTVASKLNTLCPEVATLGYRLPGLFQTVSASDNTQMGEYDEAIVIDGNGYKTDMGAFVHAVADWAVLSNSYATTYANNIAGVVCGLCSKLDEKSALTNKVLPAVTQLYRLTMAQMNNLVQAKVNVLRFKGDGVQPALLHDRSAALLSSDYTFLLRTRIKFLVTKQLFAEADKYIGQSSADGLTMAALKTALDADLIGLQKRGYLQGYAFNVYATQASQRIGQLYVNIVFSPANELVQISANISAGNS